MFGLVAAVAGVVVGLIKWLVCHLTGARTLQQHEVQEAEQKGREETEAGALEREYHRIEDAPPKKDDDLLDDLNRQFRG